MVLPSGEFNRLPMVSLIACSQCSNQVISQGSASTSRSVPVRWLPKGSDSLEEMLKAFFRFVYRQCGRYLSGDSSAFPIDLGILQAAKHGNAKSCSISEKPPAEPASKV